MLGILLQFLPKIFDIVAKNLDPSTQLEVKKTLVELELRARQAEAEVEKARADEFAAFVAATQPSSNNVHLLVNSGIALVRPAMAVFSLAAPFLWPQEWRDFVWLVAQGAPWSVFALSPLLVWVVGRDALRMFFGLASIVKNGGQIPQEVLPPGAQPVAPKPSVAPGGQQALKKPWVPPLLPPVSGDNTGNDVR